MAPDKKIHNALKRSEVHRKSKREKGQAKLKRRLDNKKAEKEKGLGEERKKERLAKNIPRTLDNTRIFDSTSYLTANPGTLRIAAERVAEASRAINGEAGPSQPRDEVPVNAEEVDDEDEVMPDAQALTAATSADVAAVPKDAPLDAEREVTGEAVEEEEEEADLPPPAPPRILVTTSPSPCKETYQFCDDLRSIFPGGQFFKRPKGRGFELGRVARWAAKRGFAAVIAVNQDHKTPNAITLMQLPAGPTAYFKLSSVQLGSQIYGHARPSPHSPELILNNFTTLLGNSVGRLFGSLFPPLPQFRGRQVVTLHNQRDFLFFRRHRYMFASATSARLQEIGPRFTLKLRWLRKGLPAVTAGDGQVPRGGDPEDIDEEEISRQEKRDEDEAMEEMGKGQEKRASAQQMGIPPLDEEQEYEWKWKPKMEVSRRTFFL